MAMSTLQDNEIMANLYKDALSPITNYSQGLLALALQKQQADQAAQAERRKQAFQISLEQQKEKFATAERLAYDKMQFEAEARRTKAAHDRLLEQIKLEHDNKTADAQDAERRKFIADANEYGADLPKDASWETASHEFVKRRGDAYVASMKRYGQALRDTMSLTNIDPKAFLSRVASAVADSEEVKGRLTPAERELIRQDPKNIEVLRKKFATSDKKKYDALTSADKLSRDFITLEMDKAALGKPAALRAASDLKMASDEVAAIRAKGGFSPQVQTDADEVYRNAAFPPAPPTAAVDPNARPSPAYILRMSGATPSAANQPGLYPMTPQQLGQVQAAAPAPAAPYAFQGGPALTIPPDFSQPGAVGTMVPGAIPNPQLNNFLQKNSRFQNAIAPTAFPTEDSSNF